MDSAIRIKKWVSASGQHAETLFKVLGTGKEHSYLEVHPKTGRTNQIRVHAAWCGHHLVGDKMYHPDEEVFLAYFERDQKEFAEKKTGFHRCALHAAGLIFRHPGDGKFVEISCDLPEDLEKLWFRCLY